MLGYPSECIHQNVVRQCKFSISCWLQGGRNVKGCGDNKWLFSCCVSENDLPTRFVLKFNELKKICLTNSKIVQQNLKPKQWQLLFLYHKVYQRKQY